MKLSTRQLLISFAAFAALALIFRLVLSPTASPASTAPSVIADIPVSSPTPVHFSAPTPPVTLATNKMSASAELVKKLIADNIVMVNQHNTLNTQPLVPTALLLQPFSNTHIRMSQSLTFLLSTHLLILFYLPISGVQQVLLPVLQEG